MYNIVKDLYYKRRDLVSDDYDEALDYISKILPLKIHKIESGTSCWTWIIPEKWTVKEAYIEANGKRILDLKDHPLHVASYSIPVDMIITKEELLKHIHTNKKRPNAIPFDYKYYVKDWGFCIQHNKLKKFKYKKYHAVIKSSFEKGSIKIGEMVIPGSSTETIALVAHLCHPAMANDDLGGVAVLTKVAQILSKRENRRYTYRVLFLPETIGSIAYLSQNEEIIPTLKYGIFFEMLGTKSKHSLQLSRQANTLIDITAKHVMKNLLSDFEVGSFREVVSNDEMVFNGPGVDVPMISVSRWPYPQYHTSDDNLSIIKSKSLEESFNVIMKIIDTLEINYFPKRKFKGPPFLSRYGLWVDWRVDKKLNLMLEKIFMELEGDKTILDIAESVGLEFDVVYNYVNKMAESGLVEKHYGKN